VNGVVTRLARALEAIGALGLALMAMILCWQVFARYVLHSSPAWSEQLALVLTVWFVFLGAAAGIQLAFHIRIAEGVERLPMRWRSRVMRLAECLVCVFSLGLIIWGVQLVAKTADHAVPTLPLSQGDVYAVIPIAGAMMLLFSGYRLLRGMAAEERPE